MPFAAELGGRRQAAGAATENGDDAHRKAPERGLRLYLSGKCCVIGLRGAQLSA